MLQIYTILAHFPKKYLEEIILKNTHFEEQLRTAASVSIIGAKQ